MVHKYIIQSNTLICTHCKATTLLPVRFFATHQEPCKVDILSRLTRRELEVAKMLGNGTCVKDVAVKLDLSVKTIEAHKFRVYQKLNVHRNAELVRIMIYAEIEEKSKGVNA